MPPPKPNPRRSGKALRKNVPPSRPAPPPPTPTPRRRLPPAPQDRDAWTNNPPPEVVDKLVEEGLAYRYRKRPAAEGVSPRPRKRVCIKEPLSPWNERNARSAAMISHKVHSTPVSYARRRHVPLKIPHVQGAMLENEQFGKNAISQTLSGHSVAIAFGIEPEEEALALMSHDERKMYQYWKKGVKLPEEDWQGMDSRLKEGANRALWERRAKDLNKIYGVRIVDVGKAQAWWNASESWGPLLLACGKVRRARIEAERRTLNDVSDKLEAHENWVRASAARYDSNIDRAMQALHLRLATLYPRSEPIEKPPSSPSLQGGSPQHLAVASPATESGKQMPVTLATDLDRQENTGPATPAPQAPPTETLSSSLLPRASAPNRLRKDTGMDTDAQQEVRVTRGSELRAQPTETLMTNSSLPAWSLHHRTEAGNEADGTKSMQVRSVPGYDLVQAEPVVDQARAQLHDTLLYDDTLLLYVPSPMDMLQKRVRESSLGVDAGTEGQIPHTTGSGPQQQPGSEGPPRAYRT